MSKLKKDILDCYFVLYDLHDFETPIYFDNIFEFLKFNYKTTTYIKHMRRFFKESLDNSIIIRCVRAGGDYYKLYAYEK